MDWLYSASLLYLGTQIALYAYLFHLFKQAFFSKRKCFLFNIDTYSHFDSILAKDV